MKKRLIVAGIVLPALLSYIYFLPPFPYFFILLLLVCVVALHELYTMYKIQAKLYIPAMAFGGVLLYVSSVYPHSLIDAVFVSVSAVLLIRLFMVGNPLGSMKDIGPLCAGFFYISVFLSFQWFLMNYNDEGKKYIFLLYGVVWLSDSAAYYVGTYLGRHKLYTAISPNKTIEGAVGSILGGALGGLLIRSIFNIESLTAQSTFIIGIVLGVVAILGDLTESMIKRDAGVKDSSSIIPGHGGILDKIDGFLIAGPVFYFLLRWIN